MKKSFVFGLVLVLVGFFVAVLSVDAGTVRPLGYSAQASHGATHVAELTFADGTVATSNTIQTITTVFAVEAKQGVTVSHMILDQAWDNGDGAEVNSVTVEVGDGGDLDSFVTATEVAEDGTEVWLKYGVGTETVYTAADTIDFTLRATGPAPLSEHTSGILRVFFRVVDAR